jgi:hypothetical protein
MAIEIPSFPVESVGSQEARAVFSTLGVENPMMAVTGIDVTPYQSLTDMAKSPTHVGADQSRQFFDLGRSVLSTLAAREVAPVMLRYVGTPKDAQEFEYRKGEDDISALLFNRASEDFGFHLDFQRPSGKCIVYGLHLFIGGYKAIVEASRARVERLSRQEPRYEVIPPTHSRESTVGDAHIFVRLAPGVKDYAGPPKRRKLVASASCHGFKTIGDDPRMVLQTHFA